MTLTRGGILATPPGGASVTLPFDDDGGGIFVPAHVLNQDGWALLDSGSDVTQISLKSAKAAATQLPAVDSKTVVTNKQFGVGSTAKKTTFIKLGVPVPISLNTAHQASLFSTTTQFGGSDIDDVLDAAVSAGGNMNAQLGFPFFLQFQRIIIDYPAHTLVLQYPVKDTPLKVEDFPTKHDRAWPGYKWLQKGYGWIEVPDGKSLPIPVNAPVNGATVVTTANGSFTVTANGVTKIYPAPLGSSITVNPDGSVQVLPPRAANSAH